MKKKRRVICVDVGRCMGCHSCVLACAVEHSQSKSLEKALAEETRPQSRVHMGAFRGKGVPLQCRQCEDAPCVAVCPTKSLHRLDQDSPVLIDHDKCIGCKWCILACPFGVITMDAGGKTVIKCDQCNERVEKGGLPACVTACPTGALKFVTVDEIVDGKRSAYLVQISEGLGGEQR